MTHFVYLCFMTGILMEFLYLFFNNSKTGWTVTLIQEIKPYWKKISKKVYIIAAALLALTAGVITVFNWWEPVSRFLFEQPVNIADKTLSVLIVPGATLIGFNIIYNAKILPAVNEQSVVMMLIIFWYNIIARTILPAEMVFVYISIAFSAFSLLFVLPKFKMNMIAKSIVYLWFLFMLFYTTVIHFPANLLDVNALSAGDAFLLGGAGVYILFYSSFFLRFSLICLSYWSKKNREYVKPILEVKFSDYQLPLKEAVIYMAVLIAALAVNHIFKLVEVYMLTLAAMVTLFQIMSYRLRKRVGDTQ